MGAGVFLNIFNRYISFVLIYFALFAVTSKSFSSWSEQVLLENFNKNHVTFDQVHIFNGTDEFPFRFCITNELVCSDDGKISWMRGSKW